MPDATRDITLRTLAADAGAISQNTHPQGSRITLHIKTTAAPAETLGQPAAEKKRSPLIIILVVIFLLGALGGGGYFVYRSITIPYAAPQ